MVRFLLSGMKIGNLYSEENYHFLNYSLFDGFLRTYLSSLNGVRTGTINPMNVNDFMMEMAFFDLLIDFKRNALIC